MKETKMYQAIMITSMGAEIMRVSNSKKLLNEFLREYIYRYIKDLFPSDNIDLVTGENCYTAFKANKNFLCCWKIVEIRYFEASPEELEEEKRETEKTSKNDTYAE